MTVTVSNVQSNTQISATFKLAPPLANFTATPRAGFAPLTVQFYNTSSGNPTSFTWDFGDGNTTNSTMQNPVHTYSNKGNYTVSLTATNAGGSNITEKTNYINVTVSAPTISSITPNYGPTKGGTAVTIKGTNFVSGGSFGVKVGGWNATNVSRINATTITAKTPLGSEGIRTVVVINNDGQTATKVGGFTYIAPPLADFTGTPTSGTAPLTVNFTDTSTNTPNIWKWTFGDSSTTNDTQKNPVHTYISSGKYTVSLNATNSSCGSNITTKTKYINVTAPLKPVANFTGIPTSGYEPLTVIFTDTSTNKPNIWKWTFGDGSTTNDTEKNPVHTYLMAGEYNVSLTASNTAGSNTTTKGGSNTKTTGYISVFIQPPPPPP
jgi:PKD repeat protein